MQRDNHSKFIPPNFDLSKYNTANLDLLTWLHNLQRRLDSDTYLGQPQLEVNSEETILGNIDLGVATDTFLTEAMIKSFLVNDKAQYLSVTRELTCYEVMAKGEELFSDDGLTSIYTNLDAGQTLHTFQRSLGKLNNVLAADGINEDGSYRAWLEVDLSCSDAEIKESFNSWLKHVRDRTTKRAAKQSRRRNYKLNKLNETTFRKWHDAKVLPYLDLIAWNLLKGNKITSAIIGDILFSGPNERPDPTATVNDTVKPLAQKLTSSEQINRMVAVLFDTYRKKIN